MLTMAFALLVPIGMLGLLLALGRYEEGMLTGGHDDAREPHTSHRRRRRWVLVPVPHRRPEEVAR